MYITPGRNPIIELLKSDIDCQVILIERDINKDAKLDELLKLAKDNKVKVQEASFKELNKLVDKDTPHQGVIAYAKSFSPELKLESIAKDSLENQFYIYIREAQYEHNFAAIIRTAECLGASGVIVPPELRITPNASRIAMGANFHMPITKNSLFNTIKLFKKAAYRTIAIEISGEKNIFEADLSFPTLLIVGGEDRSISQEIAEQVDELLLIPQVGNVNSLNMSVAASLVIYERLRQLNTK